MSPIVKLLKPRRFLRASVDKPVAQLDRALPSEGRGQRFESSRVRQSQFQALCFMVQAIDLHA